MSNSAANHNQQERFKNSKLAVQTITSKLVKASPAGAQPAIAKLGTGKQK